MIGIINYSSSFPDPSLSLVELVGSRILSLLSNIDDGRSIRDVQSVMAIMGVFSAVEIVSATAMFVLRTTGMD
jgi:hypothetical protein